jgi:hypothetical protein
MVRRMVQHISDSIKIAGQLVDRATLTGLQNASQKSGVSFQYLVAKAAQESSLQSDAQADTSSATGLFQFTRGTWLDMMKKYGPLYGYNEAAQKIHLDNDGKPVIKDHAAEARILALRNNPEASALMAAEYARDNAESLHAALGRGVDAPDLYLAHFLGAGGARQLLAAAADTPHVSAASLLPAAAKANTSIFYTPEGRARSAAEVVKLVRERFSNQLDRYADLAVAVSGQDAVNAFAAERAARDPAPSTGPMIDYSKLAPKEPETRDPTKAMVSHYILEEMAKLIAAKPMSMGDEDENEESMDTTALGSTSGLQGADWAAALTRSLSKDGLQSADLAALERSNAKARAAEAKSTYDMLNAVPAVPFVPVRRDDPS